MASKLTEAMAKVIACDYKRGTSLGQLAKLTGICEGSLKRVIRHEGVTIRPKTQEVIAPNEETLAQRLAAIKKNWTPSVERKRSRLRRRMNLNDVKEQKEVGTESVEG